MFIQITTKIGCSNNCVYCPQSEIVRAYHRHDPKASVFMGMGTFSRLLKKIPKHIGFVFCGMCEPFLNPGCTDMILAAVADGRKVALLTTLIGLTLKDAKRLENVSFDGDFYVHLPSDDNIEQFPITKEYISVLTYVLKRNMIGRCMYFGNAIHKDVRPIMYSFSGRVDHYTPHDRCGKNTNGRYKTSRKRFGAIYCGCWGHVILPDATVLLCSNDYGMEYVLGNLRHQDYTEITRSKTLQKALKNFSDDTEDTLCRRCYDAHDSSAKAVLMNNPGQFHPKLWIQYHAYTIAPALYESLCSLKSAVGKDQACSKKERERWYAK